MKYVKLIGLAAVAAMALMAFAGAGTASAETTLCKVSGATCPAGSAYPKGTEIVASLEKETSALLHDTSNAIVNTCTGSETKGKTSNETGASIEGPISTLTFTGCRDTTVVLKNGSLTVSHIAGTNNGTVTAIGSEVTMIFSGVSCTYGAGAGTDIGTLTGSKPNAEPPEPMATMDINAVIHKTAGGFLCPETSVWEAKYTVTSPEPLFVTG